MKRKHSPRILKLTAAMLALPLLLGAASKICVTGPPTAESYTWNFKEEASQLLGETRWRAQQVQMQADLLESFSRQPAVNWQSHANTLTQIRAEVNSMGADLCRLHTIRRVTDPWEQAAIDRVTPEVVTLANQTELAIEFLKENPANLWNPTYTHYVASLYDGSGRLSQKTYGGFESASTSPQQLEKESQLMAANYCGS
jgi:hypothetical protein